MTCNLSHLYGFWEPTPIIHPPCDFLQPSPSSRAHVGALMGRKWIGTRFPPFSYIAVTFAAKNPRLLDVSFFSFSRSFSGHAFVDYLHGMLVSLGILTHRCTREWIRFGRSLMHVWRTLRSDLFCCAFVLGFYGGFMGRWRRGGGGIKGFGQKSGKDI